MQEINLKRRNRVFKSLHKPLTYLGVERTLFYFICVGAVGVFNLFESLLAGIIVFIGGYAFGRWISVGGRRGGAGVVVPAPAVGTCARLLASQFDRLCVFRLEHPESVRFNQVVVFGRRKKSHLRGDPKGADELLKTAYKPHLLPVLSQEAGERYAIPPLPPAKITYEGLPLDAIEDALHRSVAMQNARGVLVRKQQRMSGRPVTPLHRGHVGLLACSGMLNGFFGEGEMRHIAHWRSVKHVDEFNEEGESEGETIIRKRERFSHELTLAYQDGRIVELKETKEEGRQACAAHKNQP